ncbi:hypothetical protein AQUCO_08100007v1 [Aquilegia coerulea]|uniref:Uncharacterized protein n=1 Tax=Aquilegia coerulea TaxID=218851 RepID=A0A2G5C8X8_AQUCA|nr:hypothetical protein AQUCO_08100007v1 [Aquilegia coerulea]PIA27266.1 hypothetical protein AQUCO_08100007v1 [Aquilegia coerulea]PIA27267.1 hypothetical protein AQUCO_08100007v1 [Aquilegia coerulea]
MTNAMIRRASRLSCLLRRSFCSNSNKRNNHIGIDFGSTNTYVAVMEGNKPKLVVNHPSQTTITAKVIQDAILETNTVVGLKRLIGRTFEDPIVQKEMKMLPCKIVRGSDGNTWVETTYGDLLPTGGILALFLNEMKIKAETYLGKSVSSAVITFPMNFTDLQAKTLMVAAKVVGLNLQRAIDEPTAAAIAYGLVDKECIFAVVDVGGRTTDVSILEVSNRRFQFKGPTKSDIFLGGQDFDKVITDDYLMGELNASDVNKNIIKMQEDVFLFRSFCKVAENAKIELSTTSETAVKLPYPDRPKWIFDTILTRTKFESLVKDLNKRIKNQCESCLKEAGLTFKDVDEVLLVGGMARVPRIKKTVAEVFGKMPTRGVNPEEAVALGAAAAVQAGYFGEDAWDIPQ